MHSIDFLHDGERVELDVQRFRLGVPVIIGVWAVPAMVIVVGFLVVNRFVHGSNALYLDVALLAILALFTLIAYASTLIYTRNRLILTNKRIIIFTHFGLSSRRIAQCHLEFIQDVSTHYPNLIAEMFDYGDVFIETSGKEERFVFPTCQHPHDVSSRIVRLCKQTAVGDETAPAVIAAESLEVDADQPTELPAAAGPAWSDLPFELPKPSAHFDAKRPIESEPVFQPHAPAFDALAENALTASMTGIASIPKSVS